jgi:hypothetical protein
MPVHSHRNYFIFPFKISSPDFPLVFVRSWCSTRVSCRDFQPELGLASVSIFLAANSFSSVQFGLGHHRFLGLPASSFCPTTTDFPYSGYRWLRSRFSLLPSFSCSSRSQLLPSEASIHCRSVSFGSRRSSR